jgi:hypothetical protein
MDSAEKEEKRSRSGGGIGSRSADDLSEEELAALLNFSE